MRSLNRFGSDLEGDWSSRGDFDGLGGGGGPGVVPDDARGRAPAARLDLAYLPASAIGGGARNLGRGGDGSLGLVDVVDSPSCPAGDASMRPRLEGGGGGGPRRPPLLLPVFCGLSGADLGGGGADGGGGGGAFDRL